VTDRPTDAERVAEAVATGAGLDALAGSLTDPVLLAVVAAAQARLRPELSPEAWRLLRAVAAFPGSGAQDLRDVTLLDAASFATASRELLAHGLVASTRFDVPDCWSRTAAGAALLRDA
jgi:DNA-binding MarR family transcriptional regulator